MANKKNNKPYSWLWEFSKKVVVAMFIIWVINYIVCWSVTILAGIYSWNISYIDTFITSTNETTQIVLGGYLIKAMAENVIKTKNITLSNKSNKDKLDDVVEDEFLDEDSSF